ncbi:MAG: hypothetical protein IPP07_17425 [Holophagales bacterium]|nr:hypothetical protein [Holophagales bacterium]
MKGIDPQVTGSVAWRRYPTKDPFVLLPMVREGGELKAALPHQPPAGKLEYQVRLQRGAETVVFPASRPSRGSRGAVPAVILAPHIVTMFTGMLVANAASLALRGEKSLLRISSSSSASCPLAGSSSGRSSRRPRSGRIGPAGPSAPT